MVQAIVLRASMESKTRENEPNLSHGETKDFASLVVSHWNHYLRNPRRFARSFVFNNLIAFSFRLFRGLRSPTPQAQLQRIVKRPSGSASHRRAA
jgi:hypothetical protein